MHWLGLTASKLNCEYLPYTLIKYYQVSFLKNRATAIVIITNETGPQKTKCPIFISRVIDSGAGSEKRANANAIEYATSELLIPPPPMTAIPISTSMTRIIIKNHFLKYLISLMLN